MTQLFDTTTYEDSDRGPDGDLAIDEGRHLRSIPAGGDVAERTTQWRLDSQTIETGRKGIRAAREALQAAAREVDSTKPARKAA